MNTEAKTKTKEISYVICDNFEGAFNPLFGHFETRREALRCCRELQRIANDPVARKSKYARFLPKPGADIFVVRSEWTRITPLRLLVRPRQKAA